MNEELRKLYEREKSEFVSISKLSSKEIPVHGPFLMSPDNLYFNSKVKLLVVGKETYGWPCHADDIDLQMSEYKDFNVGQFYYSSPFWSVIRKLERTLGNAEYSCAWTNLSKFDVDQGSPYGEYEQEISKLDGILIEEIDILRPNVCMFFTGPSLDSRIQGLFDGVKFKSLDGWSDRALCKLGHPNLPEFTFRTYHPNYLRRSGYEEEFLRVIRKLTADL